MGLTFDTSDPEQRARGLASASAALRRGELVALPLEGGYALAADAFSERGVSELRETRGRADLVPQVLVGRIRAVAGVAVVRPAAQSLMRDFWPGQLTLLLSSQPSLAWPVCAPGGRIAVRQPLHPVALELAGSYGPLAVVPAALGSGAPASSMAELAETLSGRFWLALDGGPMPAQQHSTVVAADQDPPRLVRAGALAVSELVAYCPQVVLPAAPPPSAPSSAGAP